MSSAEARALAVQIRRTRKARGLSMHRLAETAGIQQATLFGLEHSTIQSPQPDTLVLIARALQLRVADLFVIAGWLPAAELPELGPYLRGKYRELDDDQISDVEHYLRQVLSTCHRARTTAR